MASNLEAFNSAFGFAFVSVGGQSVWKSFVTKGMLTIPVYAFNISNVASHTTSMQPGLGKARILRGYLYGSFVGAPLGLALDVGATLTTQVANIFFKFCK